MPARVKKQLLSVIVPSYKEGKTIKSDLETIDKTLSKGLPEKYTYEIICVEDGQFDNTSEQVNHIKSPRIRLISYKTNKGKGYAVRQGMKAAKGDLISFMDAGRDIAPKGLMMLLAHMEWYDADIIIGSKRHPASKLEYPPLRRFISIGYHMGVKVLFGIKVTDTQSGIKIFKRKVVEAILPKLLVKRFAMDVEMLAVANHLGFTRIYEAPIEVDFDKNKEVTALVLFGKNSLFSMLWDTLAVFYRLRILHFYD